MTWFSISCVNQSLLVVSSSFVYLFMFSILIKINCLRLHQTDIFATLGINLACIVYKYSLSNTFLKILSSSMKIGPLFDFPGINAY